MADEQKKASAKPKKKPYKKPSIKSSKFYERHALACPKAQDGPLDQGCGPADPPNS